MKRVTMFQTLGGALHPTLKQAIHAADEAYGQALTKLARDMTDTDGRYGKVLDFISTNLDRFVSLKALRDDLTLIEDEAED